MTGFAPDWPAPPSVRAWVSERRGGVSTAGYAELNLGAHVGDEPARVAENRRRLVRMLGLPGEPAWLEQVHGTEVLDLDRAPDLESDRPSHRERNADLGRDVDSALAPVARADGAVTSRAGVVCAVLTADCLPVLLCDRDGQRVGVAHAGWRGLVGGVLPSAVAAMQTPARDLLAWLGPAIGPEAYEVGAEVRDAALLRDPGATVAFAPNARGRWQANLYVLARRSLEAAGITAIHGGGFCTFSDSDRFFSHRRAAPCGRMATLIWLRQPP
jgi:hypothetical protein